MENVHHVVQSLMENCAIEISIKSLKKRFAEHLFSWEGLMMEWKSILNQEMRIGY